VAAKDPIVVVGGGRAAASLVDAYREAGGEALITILSADSHPPYNRPPLSKFILRGEMPPEDSFVHPADEYEERLVELRLGTRVEAVNPDAHEVSLAGGETVPYGTLVIASGTTPRTLQIPGADLPAVHTFRTLEDATTVRDAAADARKALVVGGSFIGSEVAASLRMVGLDVTIVELGERLAPQLGSPELSDQIADLYREQGVELLLGEQLEEFRANGRMLVGARTASGVDIEAFIAVVGVGVAPETGFLDGSGIEVDNGVVVDDRFRASVDDVYAIGDVARFYDDTVGRSRRIEHWSNANAQGLHLGRILAGDDAAYDHVAAFFTKMFDVQLQVLGDPDGGVDEVFLRGSIASGHLLGLYLREERLVGAVVTGQTPDMVEELTTLLREQPKLRDRSHLTTDGVRPVALFETATV
jgi:3-phenylpropionate/trans-cinnamate dioxygenase ferredoxin reductase component